MQLTAQVSIFAGVQDTSKADLLRTMATFGAINLLISANNFPISGDATRRMLGTDGALSIKGGPETFDHADPATGKTVSISDPNGRFTTEVWNAIRDWTRFGGVRIFYVKKFENPYEAVVQGNQIQISRTGGITLQAGDLFDPVIFIDQSQNLEILKKTSNRFGLLEHEIGHALGLDHSTIVGSLMYAQASDRSSNSLTQAELDIVRRSRLLSAEPTPWMDYPDTMPKSANRTA